MARRIPSDVSPKLPRTPGRQAPGKEGSAAARPSTRAAISVLLVLLGLAPGGLVFVTPATAGPALAAAHTLAAVSTLAAEPLTLDPSFSAPSAPVSLADQAAIECLLDRQAAALRALDRTAYLRTFADPAGARPGDGVAGDPSARVARDLFGTIPPDASIAFAQIAPVFITPGPDGQVEVLARHLIAYREFSGEPGLAEVTAIERLRPLAPARSSGQLAWEVFDWILTDEPVARLTWPTWLDGRVTLEPFDGRLRAEMTYTFFAGNAGEPVRGTADLTFALADTLEVTAVRGATGELSWRRESGGLTVDIPDGGAPGRPLTVTVLYQGKIAAGGTPRRGNLEYLGAEVIYLRPESGWYPRPSTSTRIGGSLRGFVAVTVPGWWGAATSGRLVHATPAAGMGQVRTFTWGLDLPTDIYLAAGPYLIADLVTAQGITLRAFFYAREAEWAQAYLAETERILKVLSERFGPYPYGDLTLAEVQDFYYGGLSARTLVLLEKEWQADPGGQAWARDLLAHEISHQWWGEMIPVKGKADWFLWEGLASYSEALYAEEIEGPEGLRRVMALKAKSYAEAVRSHSRWSLGEANVRATDWQDAFVYDKGAWLFHSLRFLVGDEVFFDLLRAYVDRFAGRQPQTADLAALIAEMSPDDPYLAEFTNKWVDEAADPDLTLSGVSLVGPGEAGSGQRLAFDLVDKGSGSFPRAEIRIVYADGQVETFMAGTGRNTVDLPGRLTSLVVDPDHKILDLARQNNTWFFVGSLGVSRVWLCGCGYAVLGTVLLAAVLGVVRWVRRRGSPPDPAD